MAPTVAALCGMWSRKWHQMILFGWFQFWWGICLPLCGRLPTTASLQPYKSTYGIGYASKSYLKWWAIWLAIHYTVASDVWYSWYTVSHHHWLFNQKFNALAILCKKVISSIIVIVKCIWINIFALYKHNLHCFIGIINHQESPPTCLYFC